MNSTNTSSLQDTLALPSSDVSKLTALKNGVYNNVEYSETVTMNSAVYNYNSGEAKTRGRGVLGSISNLDSNGNIVTKTNTFTEQIIVISTNRNGEKHWAHVAYGESSITYLPKDKFFNFTGATFTASAKLNGRSNAKVTYIAYSLDVYAW